jgi:tRNA (cytidine32/guanosine34-2'-O)-methyltransferase
MISPLLNYSKVPDELVGSNRTIVPFIACGSLAGFDSDQSYPLQNLDKKEDSDEKELYRSLDPIQKPINPPYAKFLEQRKAKGQGK